MMTIPHQHRFNNKVNPNIANITHFNTPNKVLEFNILWLMVMLFLKKKKQFNKSYSECICVYVVVPSINIYIFFLVLIFSLYVISMFIDCD